MNLKLMKIYNMIWLSCGDINILVIVWCSPNYNQLYCNLENTT